MSTLLPPTSSLPVCEVLPARAADGAYAEVLLQLPAGSPHRVLYWLPALGVSARQYLPLAQALAQSGVAVAIHEWRGIGSSDRRASRQANWSYRNLLEDDLPAGLAAVRQRLPVARCLFGGHSLGAQLASLYAGLHPERVAGLVLVASGSPYWRQFPQDRLIWLALTAAPWLARLCGYLPGRRMGFGGNEARGVIDDWARSGRTGRYAAVGMPDDFEARLGRLTQPLLALRLADDWLAPEASLSWLLGKMPQTRSEQQLITSRDMDGRPADHFGWMKAPRPVAGRIAAWSAGLSPVSDP
ncbi:alpha/beta hydrolase family protein [Dyella amyloliquefaciens]|uniref:alpha/beta hydrolase family protein n=1 Tax=Dyella amyloliquefaciens TaxID=1770545 RepID=UPI00102E6AA1|nr:alpha/beta fold hydrolase [Dyella amyloliquefaciens]